MRIYTEVLHSRHPQLSRSFLSPGPFRQDEVESLLLGCGDRGCRGKALGPRIVAHSLFCLVCGPTPSGGISPRLQVLTDNGSGNSYTTTGFDIHGNQPSAANPMGNPAIGELVCTTRTTARVYSQEPP